MPAWPREAWEGRQLESLNKLKWWLSVWRTLKTPLVEASLLSFWEIKPELHSKALNTSKNLVRNTSKEPSTASRLKTWNRENCWSERKTYAEIPSFSSLKENTSSHKTPKGHNFMDSLHYQTQLTATDAKSEWKTMEKLHGQPWMKSLNHLAAPMLMLWPTVHPFSNLWNNKKIIEAISMKLLKI